MKLERGAFYGGLSMTLSLTGVDNLTHSSMSDNPEAWDRVLDALADCIQRELLAQGLAVGTPKK